MKINHLTTLFAILATMLFAVACGEEAAEETTEEPTAAAEPLAEEATEEAEDPAPVEAEEPAAEEAAAGGSACDRAQDCCEAYVGEMTAMGTPGVSVEQTCGTIAQLSAAPTGAASCEQMIGSWRTALETAQRTVPSSCAAQ